MGFSPLRGDNTPTPTTTTPGQMAMNLVEDLAKDLETVLNVAETGVKSLLSRIRAGEKVIARTPPAADSSWITNDNDDNNDSDAALHDIIEEEFNHPPINTSIGDQRQYNMEMENMYDELSDHNNHLLPLPLANRLFTAVGDRTQPHQQQPLLPPPCTPAPPPPPIPPRKRLSPPYPILSPPPCFVIRQRLLEHK